MAIRFAEDPTASRLADLERRVSELEALLRNVTPVTRNADRNVTRNAAGNAAERSTHSSNAERQRRYRKRRDRKSVV